MQPFNQSKIDILLAFGFFEDQVSSDGFQTVFLFFLFFMSNHYVWDVVFSDGFCRIVEQSTLLLDII